VRLSGDLWRGLIAQLFLRAVSSYLIGIGIGIPLFTILGFWRLLLLSWRVSHIEK